MRALARDLRPALTFFSESKSSLGDLLVISATNRADLDVIITSYHETWNSREKYRKVVDTISYIIIQTNPNGKIIFVNKAVSFLGFDGFDLIGQDFKDFC